MLKLNIKDSIQSLVKKRRVISNQLCSVVGQQQTDFCPIDTIIEKEKREKKNGKKDINM